jgi:hypothetical protein
VAFRCRPSGKEVSSLICNWLTSVPEHGEMIVNGLFAALESAAGYIPAGATAERIADLDSLTEEQWTRLDELTGRTISFIERKPTCVRSTRWLTEEPVVGHDCHDR